MPGYVGKKTNDASDAVGQVSQTERDTTWGPIPGEVVSYDASAGTATIKPLYKAVVNGKEITLPDLYEVPIDQPRTGNAALTMPIPSGTKVILAPQMRAWDDFEEGGDGKAYDARSFHISNMRATLQGGDPLSDPLPNADSENTHLRFDAQGQYGLKGSPDGKVKLEGSEGNIYELIVQLVELLESDSLLIAYGSSQGTGHQLQHRAQYGEIAAKLRAMML